MNGDSATSQGTLTGIGLSDTFSGITTVIGSNGGAVFQPGSATGVDFIGNQGASNELSLQGETGSFVVSMNGDSYPSSPGSLFGVSVTLSDTFSGVTTVIGSNGGAVFQPGTATGVDFIGNPGTSNELSLQLETGSFTVSMNGDDYGLGTSHPGTLTGVSVTLSDTFSGVNTVIGSSGGTIFQPGSATGVTFIGNPSAHNELDLTFETASFLVSMNGDSYPSSPGWLSGVSVTLSDSFSAVNTVIGSAGTTVFQPGSVTGVDFIGNPGAHNELSLQFETGSFVVSMNGDTYPGSQGTLTGVSVTMSDTFSGINTVIGSNGGTVFQPGTAVGSLNFIGQGSGNVLSLANVNAPGANIDVTTGKVTTTGTLTDSFSDVQSFVGSPAGGNDFVAPGTGGYTFTGEGSGNRLDLSAAPIGTTVTLNGDSSASPGIVSGLNGGTSDEFSDIQFFNVTPAIATTPQSAAVTLGSSAVTLRDTATLSGGLSPSGSITFTLFANGGSTPVDTETVTVSGDGTYQTPTGFTLPTGVTVTGTYQWDAAYSGDANNNPSFDVNAANEVVAVSAASPTIATTPSGGHTLNDVATLANGFAPTGTITFTLFAPGLTTPIDTETVTVNGNGVYSTPTGYTLHSPGIVSGTYQWDATYSGDTNNNPSSDSNAANERLVVNASPTIVTNASQSAVTLGSAAVTLKDSATLAGGTGETGSITFVLYGPANTALDTETVTVSGNGVYSTTVGFTLPSTGKVTGTYEWAVSYGGDPNNNPASSAQGSEPVIVSAAQPTLSTTPSPGAVTLGASAVTLSDSAVLSDGYHEAGTVTFTLMAPGGAVVDTETVTASGDGSYSTPVGYTLQGTSTVTGTYQWNAAYSGDSNNHAASHTNAPGEQVTVARATPLIATAPSSASVTLGTAAPTLKDTATLSGGYSETGALTFILKTPGGSVADTETVTVSGNGNYATPAGFTLPTIGAVTGTYQWTVVYNGDGNNNAATGAGENVVVSPASPELSTSPSPASMTLGATADDSASMAGAYSGTGTLTFGLYSNPSCTNQVFASVSTVSPLTSSYTSETFTPSAAGTFFWGVKYSGDANNNGFTTACGPTGETLTVNKAQPTIATVLQPGATEPLGTATSDTASIGGTVARIAPQGQVSYSFFSGSPVCGGPPTSQAVTVNGDGSVPSSPAQNLPAGSYSFLASYSGDPNYLKATSTCEQLTVQRGTATISTTINPSIFPQVGTTVSDTASATGVSAFPPSGTATITLYPGSACSGTSIRTQAGIALGTPSTGTSSLSAGSYSYEASAYSGDSNYVPGSSGPCEPFSVQPSPTTTAVACSPNPATIGSSTTCTATVTGYHPSGAITFTSSSSTGAFIPANGQCTLTGGFCSVTYTDTSAGIATITGSYGRDINNNPSTGSTSLTENYKDCSTLVPNKGGANLKGANLEYCNLAGYDLSGDNLMGANMQFTNLQNANLQGANLKGASLAYTSATGANLQGTNLMGDSLHGGNFMNANFQGANLKSTDLSNGNFSHANFQGANLMGSNMSYGDFDYADFTGANTNGVTTTGATFVGAINPP